MKSDNTETSFKTAVIKSPVTLTPDQLDRLKSILQKKFGSELTFKNIVRPEVLAGFTVSIGDWYLDASLKTDLRNLRKQLI